MNSNFQYVVDLERCEVPEGTLSQTIVWPFYYWSAVVPEQITEEIPNIFEQLYMSIKMVSKDIEPQEIFRQLHIEPELYKSVENSCEEDGFDVESLKIKNDNLASIKIFKDAVVGNLVPELTIKDIPKEYKLWDVEYKPSYNTANKNKPDIYEIEKMLNRFKTNRRRFHEETVLDVIDTSVEDDKPGDDDEGDWNQEALKPAKEEIITMAEAEAEKENLASMVQIDDIYPELVWVRTKIYIDPRNPEIVHMLSPFKNVPNGFFDRILAFAVKEEDFQESMEYFKADMLDKVKDSVAFNNDFNIPILDRYPILSNYEAYADIKRRIQDLNQAKVSIVKEKGDAYDTYFSRCGKLLEAISHHIIYGLNREDREKVKKYIHVSDFSYQMIQILESLEQEDISKVRCFPAKYVYACLDRKKITPKSTILVLALYVAKINQGKMTFFTGNPHIVSDIYMIYDIRNKYNHNNDIDSDNETNPYILVESSYKKLMEIVGAITENFLKVEK